MQMRVISRTPILPFSSFVTLLFYFKYVLITSIEFVAFVEKLLNNTLHNGMKYENYKARFTFKLNKKNMSASNICGCV